MLILLLPDCVEDGRCWQSRSSITFGWGYPQQILVSVGADVGGEGFVEEIYVGAREAFRLLWEERVERIVAENPHGLFGGLFIFDKPAGDKKDGASWNRVSMAAGTFSKEVADEPRIGMELIERSSVPKIVAI
jgi:hypothetical protein